MRKRVITKGVVLDVSLGDIVSQLRSTLQAFAMDARERDDKQSSDAIQAYAAEIGRLTADLIADTAMRRGNELY